jgi:putative membrane protein
MMNDWGMGWGGGGMWFGPLFWIGLLVIVLMVAISMSRRQSSGADSRESRSGTPREILDARFAKGEIEREEYETRRKALV